MLRKVCCSGADNSSPCTSCPEEENATAATSATVAAAESTLLSAAPGCPRTAVSSAGSAPDLFVQQRQPAPESAFEAAALRLTLAETTWLVAVE